MIYEYFKVSDTDESVLDPHEILKVELKNDNVQSVNTRWDETIISMKKQPDDEILEYCFIVSFKNQSNQGICCRCTFKILFKIASLETTPDQNDGCPVFRKAK